MFRDQFSVHSIDPVSFWSRETIRIFGVRPSQKIILLQSKGPQTVSVVEPNNCLKQAWDKLSVFYLKHGRIPSKMQLLVGVFSLLSFKRTPLVTFYSYINRLQLFMCVCQRRKHLRYKVKSTWPKFSESSHN